jgi:hypothetical protein
MKLLLSIEAIIALSFLSGKIGLPWYFIAIISCVICAAMPTTAFKAWLASFAAIFILWGGLAFFISSRNEHILANKMAQVLPLGGSWIALVLVSALLGAIVAGFAGLSGFYFRKIIKK